MDTDVKTSFTKNEREKETKALLICAHSSTREGSLWYDRSPKHESL